MARSRSHSRSTSRSPSRSRSSRHRHESSRRDDRTSDRYGSSSSSRSSRRDHYDQYDRRPRSRSPRRARDTDAPRRGGARTEDQHPVASSSPSSSAAAPPKTREENGEISMSIEETNKLRISLGMKPLSVAPKKDKNVVNLQKTSQQLAVEAQRLEMKKALEKSRKKRELAHKMGGKSIGEQLKETTAATALDWVKQSRVAASEAQKKTQKKHQDTQPEYDASALAGMTVAHDLGAFEDGDEVILTLKDSRVLADDGHDVNMDDDQDELVNVEISERERREKRHKNENRLKMPVYAGFDDDEFLEMGMANKKKTSKKKNALLAQYDEDEESKQAEDDNKFTLDAHGALETRGRVDGKEEDQERDVDVQVVTLAMNKQRAMDDLYTAEEMETQFAKKNKSKKLRKKKKTSMRHKENEEEEKEKDEAGDSKSLIQQLEEEAAAVKSKDKGDRGRRRRRPATGGGDGDDDEEEEEDASLRRFQEAREKAGAEAQAALLQAASVVVKKKRNAAAAFEEEDAVDLELSATLARARRLAQLQQQQQQERQQEQQGHAILPASSLWKAEDKIAALVATTVGLPVDATATRGEVGSSSETAAVPPPLPPAPPQAGNVFGDATPLESQNTVVFNNATDFETRLKSAMEQRTAQYAMAQATAATQAAAKKTEKDKDPDAMEIDDEDQEEKQEEDQDEDQDDGWADDQPLVGMGMGLGATLALLKRTGDLSTTRIEKQAGRANDARDKNVDAERQVKDGVKLDYRDEFGRLLTKKEAFRLLSYKFHGHKPGKKKQEKRLKQLKEELHAQKLLSGEGSTKMMKMMESKQGQTKQAYVVLSNGT